MNYNMLLFSLSSGRIAWLYNEIFQHIQKMLKHNSDENFSGNLCL